MSLKEKGPVKPIGNGPVIKAHNPVNVFPKGSMKKSNAVVGGPHPAIFRSPTGPGRLISRMFSKKNSNKHISPYATGTFGTLPKVINTLRAARMSSKQKNLATINNQAGPPISQRPNQMAKFNKDKAARQGFDSVENAINAFRKKQQKKLMDYQAGLGPTKNTPAPNPKNTQAQTREAMLAAKRTAGQTQNNSAMKRFLAETTGITTGNQSQSSRNINKSQEPTYVELIGSSNTGPTGRKNSVKSVNSGYNGSRKASIASSASAASPVVNLTGRMFGNVQESEV